jgi:hypothetical protein
MSKKLAFIILSVLAIAVFITGRQLDEHFLSNFWSEIFILIVGTLSTTFVLESILRHDVERRVREKDAFAFRTFAGLYFSFFKRLWTSSQSIKKCLKQQSPVTRSSNRKCRDGIAAVLKQAGRPRGQPAARLIQPPETDAVAA